MNNENKNNRNVLLYIIIILLIILIGIGGVLVYRSYSDKDIDNSNNIQDNDNQVNANNKDNSDDDNEDEVIKKDLYDKLIRYLNFKDNAYDFWYSETKNFSDSFGVLYKKDKVLIKDLSDEFKMFYVINNVECDNCEELDIGACGATKIEKNEF